MRDSAAEVPPDLSHQFSQYPHPPLTDHRWPPAPGQRPASGTSSVPVSRKPHENPLVTTYIDGIWAGDRYSTANLTTSTRTRTSHIPPMHQTITLLIISDTTVSSSVTRRYRPP
jgi:hypothetical protein